MAEILQWGFGVQMEKGRCQPAFTFSGSIIETPKQCVNKDTKTMPIASL